jgi:hypothetical protein
MTASVVDAGQGYGSFTTHSTQAGFWVNKTASGVVVAQKCMIIGFFVNSTNVGTIQLYDSPTTTANPTGGVITPAVGLQWYPAIFQNGLFVTIAGTALDVTFFYLK